jgi:branched-subunit amino acid ABC-type transport system permease component
MAMTKLVTILFLGVAFCVILYLISVGLSVTMGLMGFVNLAHGVFAMLGGYATVTLMIVLDRGRVVFEGASDALASDQLWMTALLGASGIAAAAT